MKLGVCADPGLAPAIAAAGFDFIELQVQRHLASVADEEAFQAELARIEAAPLPAPVANGFVPGALKITGTEVSWAALEAYVETTLSRAERAGAPGRRRGPRRRARRGRRRRRRRGRRARGRPPAG